MGQFWHFKVQILELFEKCTVSTQTNKQNHIVQCLKLYSIQCFPTRFESWEWCSSLQKASRTRHCICFVFLPGTVQITFTSFYSATTLAQWRRAQFSSFTANITIQVIVQVQLIKSSSVQLIVYEFHTAIDSKFSTNIP